jgi:hypothetical protein
MAFIGNWLSAILPVSAFFYPLTTFSGEIIFGGKYE